MTAQDSAKKFIDAIESQLDHMNALLEQEKMDINTADWNVVEDLASINEQIAQVIAAWKNQE